MAKMHDSGNQHEVLQLLRKNIVRQALLAGFMILLTVVLLFAVTTAWYTNVAQTSGLMFEVAAWGFTGDIWVTDSPIVAGPGDDGGVYLTLENDSDNVVDVSVYADKSTLSSPQMQKRLYFYVETTDVVNGETVDRFYLTNGNGYEYTVIGQGNLTLTENYHNDAQIKWEWVYDVLGYYVQGRLVSSVTEPLTPTNANAILAPDSKVEIEEYLRPIEYDYDPTKTTFTKLIEGESTVRLLETVDGTTSVVDFLGEVTAHDGYLGQVSEATPVTADGYYPVSIDEQGYGVWLYMCNYSEIEAATIFDTEQGMNAAAGNAAQHKVTLNISAQKSDMDTSAVSTAQQLNDALQTQGLSVVQLSTDMTMGAMSVPAGKDVVLDLNGKTLTYTTDDPSVPLMDVGEGSSVTIYNGTIQGDGSQLTGFASTGAELTFSNVTASGLETFVEVRDSDGENGVDSRVKIVGSNISASEAAVYVLGNGDTSSNLTELVIEKSVLYGGYMGVMTNGNTENSGTDITVIDSTVKGMWTSIYHPQKDSKLTVVRSTLEGYTGLVVKGGHAVITDSVINGTGEGTDTPSYSGSGFCDTGDGVYLEANYDWNTTIQIYSSTVSSAYQDAVRQYESDRPNASITIHSGTFSSDVFEYVASTSNISQNSDTTWVVSVSQSAQNESEGGAEG